MVVETSTSGPQSLSRPRSACQRCTRKKAVCDRVGPCSICVADGVKCSYGFVKGRGMNDRKREPVKGVRSYGKEHEPRVSKSRESTPGKEKTAQCTRCLDYRHCKCSMRAEVDISDESCGAATPPTSPSSTTSQSSDSSSGSFYTCTSSLSSSRLNRPFSPDWPSMLSEAMDWPRMGGIGKNPQSNLPPTPQASPSSSYSMVSQPDTTPTRHDQPPSSSSTPPRIQNPNYRPSFPSRAAPLRDINKRKALPNSPVIPQRNHSSQPHYSPPHHSQPSPSSQRNHNSQPSLSSQQNHNNNSRWDTTNITSTLANKASLWASQPPQRRRLSPPLPTDWWFHAQTLETSPYHSLLSSTSRHAGGETQDATVLPVPPSASSPPRRASRESTSPSASAPRAFSAESPPASPPLLRASPEPKRERPEVIQDATIPLPPSSALPLHASPETQRERLDAYKKAIAIYHASWRPIIFHPVTFELDPTQQTWHQVERKWHEEEPESRQSPPPHPPGDQQSDGSSQLSFHPAASQDIRDYLILCREQACSRSSSPPPSLTSSHHTGAEEPRDSPGQSPDPEVDDTRTFLRYPRADGSLSDIWEVRDGVERISCERQRRIL